MHLEKSIAQDGLRDLTVDEVNLIAGGNITVTLSSTEPQQHGEYEIILDGIPDDTE
ncbi:hypothetical protein ACWCOP_11120 [Maricaulaceae bacterium MS644]